MKKVLLRADASPSIGIGDLMSLIHLSAYFSKSGWEPHFMIRPYPAAINLINKRALRNVTLLPPGISIQDEVNAINQYCDLHCMDLLFFEITENKLSDYQGLTTTVPKACVCFDGNILPGMQLVVDWDVAACEFFNPEMHKGTRFLLGPEYVILPDRFYNDERIQARKPSSCVKNILVAMGGGDKDNFTKKVALSLAAKRPDIFLTIVVGSGYQFSRDLDASLSKLSSFWKIKQNITNMLDEYLGADLGIGAGGLTSSELVATRTPALLIATYNHQIARCRYFHEKCYASYLGFRSYDENKLCNLILTPPKPAPGGLFNTCKIVEVCNEF